jgi:hypothetical protein
MKKTKKTTLTDANSENTMPISDLSDLSESKDNTSSDNFKENGEQLSSKAMVMLSVNMYTKRQHHDLYDKANICL